MPPLPSVGSRPAGGSGDWRGHSHVEGSERAGRCDRSPRTGLSLIHISLRAADPGSAAQLLERAHAESQARQTAPAILDYERAQWLAPHATTIANQLASVRAQAGLAAPERSPLSRATHALSFDALTALASISLLMFALLVLGCLLYTSRCV